VDYKFKSSKEPKPHEKELALSAVRGVNLQPPLYLLMAEAQLTGRFHGAPSACDGVWFQYLAPKWEERMKPVPFPGDAWRSSLQESLAVTFERLLTGIRAGSFFIAPREAVCERCDFGTICRRTHQPSAWRARADSATVRAHRELRRARLPEDYAAGHDS
jgi:hypothetical protein